MRPSGFDDNVFVNCPFDEPYKPLFYATIFTIFDCGFNARSALEEPYSAENRFAKITKIIAECKYGIHDISRTEIDKETGLPRFNMPLELGLFLGAMRFGQRYQTEKKCLILDIEPYRYQRFISDLAGQDIACHHNDYKELVTCVRDWLSTASRRANIPSGSFILDDYEDFQAQLPHFCKDLKLNPNQMTFLDYAILVAEWLKLAE